jgi:hypothetical protein
MPVILRKSIELFGPIGIWLPLVLAFLFINLSHIEDGGTAANARFATLRAMSDDGTFKIDRYVDWTDDWAKTPDGHYYSNKAPGPTFAAFPLFWVLDRVLWPIQAKHIDEKGRRQAPRGIHKVVVSNLLQVIPFLFLTLLILRLAFPSGISPTAYIAASLTILFGNTAALLMNTYMGNPFTGLVMLALIYFYLRGNFAAVSFCFGWALLSEYSVAVLLIPFLGLCYCEMRRTNFVRTLRSVILGASLPALLWVWYHIACFGSPFRIPLQFEVMTLPEEVKANAGEALGFTSLIPNFEILFELLFGPVRGILFTQPWIFLVMILGFWARPKGKIGEAFLFSVVSLALLLWLNAGFAGWHGGGTPGPRYLAAILPCFGIFVPIIYERFSKSWRAVLWISIAVTIVFRGLVYAGGTLLPAVSLWPYLWSRMDTNFAIVSIISFIMVVLLTAWALVHAIRKNPGIKI